jgi:hypothetical protein
MSRAKYRGSLFDPRQFLGDQSVTVHFRIKLQEPVKEVWRSSMNGRAAFATHPVNRIGALPDSGRVFIRAVTAVGSNKDGLPGLRGSRDQRQDGACVLG